MKKIEDLIKKSPVIDKICDVVSAVGFGENNRMFCVDGNLGQNKSFIFEFVRERLNSDTTFAVKYNASQNEFNGKVIDSIIASVLSQISELEGEEELSQEAKEKLKNCKNSLILSKITIKNKQILQNTAKNELKNLKMKIVFIVEGLDNCSPQFGVGVINEIRLLFDDNFSNSCTLVSVSQKKLKEIAGSLPQDEEISKFIENAFELNAEIENINIDINRDYVLGSYLKNFDALTNKERKDFYEFLDKISSGFEQSERNKKISNADLIHKIFVRERADISVAYFELFILFVIDEFYNFKVVNFMDNKIMPKDNENLKGDAKKIFEDNFGYLESDYAQGQGSFETDILKILDMEDKKKLAFYYLRMASKKKIFYVIDTKYSKHGGKPKLRAKINHNCNLATAFFANRNRI